MAERKGMLRLWFTVAICMTAMAPVVATTPVASASEFSAGVFSASATAHDLCTGFAGCDSAGYSNFGYESVYTHSYWGQDSGHNCTNYVAYRFSAAGVGKPAWIGIGDAEMWGIWAGSITNSTPSVGAIAWWGASSYYGTYGGHVSIVQAVGSGGSFTDSDDNYGGDFHWRTYTPGGSDWPTGFIHLDDAALGGGAPWPPVNGEFVRNPDTGWIGEVVGGVLVGLTAPDCSALNCSGAAVNIDPSLIAAYVSSHTVMTSGAFVRNVGTGWIGEVVGGVLVGLTAPDCSALACSTNAVNTTPDIINAYVSSHTVMTSGAFVRNVGTGWIGEVVGGVLVGLTAPDCSALACSTNAVNTTPDIINAYVSSHTVMTSGAFVRNVGTGWIGEVVGGVLVGLTAPDCSALACSTNAVNTTPDIINAYVSSHTVMTSGAFVRNVGTGWIGEVVGGVLVGLTAPDCSALACSTNAVNTTPDIINAYVSSHTVMTSGAFVRNVGTGWIGEVVGGVLVGLTAPDCSALACSTNAVNTTPDIINAYVSSHTVMTSGAFVRNVGTGWIGEVVGGVLVGLTAPDCSALACSTNAVNTTPDIINAYVSSHTVMTSGAFTLLRSGSAKSYYRVAGGALLRVTDCQVLGGCSGAVTVMAGARLSTYSPASTSSRSRELSSRGCRRRASGRLTAVVATQRRIIKARCASTMRP